MSVNNNQKKRASTNEIDPEEDIPNPNDIIQEEEPNISQNNNSKSNEKHTINSQEVNINIEPGNEEKPKEDGNRNTKKKKTRKAEEKQEKKDVQENQVKQEKKEKEDTKKPQSKRGTAKNDEIDYINQISSMEGQIKELENNHKDNMALLSNEGKETDAKLKSISRQNTLLTKKLEKLSSELDKMILNATSNTRKILKQKKFGEQKLSENDYDAQLEQKNKEINNKQKLIDILEKDNLKLKNQMEIINGNEMEEDENKLMDSLIKKNKEITDLEKKIREYKIRVEEHNKCEKTIEMLNKFIENGKNELEMKSSQIIKQQRKNVELNNKLTMADKALTQLKQNQAKSKKLNSKKINHSIMLPYINSEANTSQLTKNKSKNNNQKYLKTQENKASKKNIKNKNPKNNQKNNTAENDNNKTYNNPQKSFKDLTDEEKANLLSIFNEEEISIIAEAINNDEKRLNEIMEKLFILKKYRSTKEKILKGNIKQNKQKLSKSIDDLEYVKKECLEKEIKIKEINSDIKKLEESNTKLKSNINKIYAQINVINSKMGNKKMIIKTLF